MSNLYSEPEQAVIWGSLSEALASLLQEVSEVESSKKKTETTYSGDIRKCFATMTKNKE